MTQSSQTTDSTLATPVLNIKVFGLGGAGCNLVGVMAAANQYSGVTCIAANTDSQSLQQSSVKGKLMLGARITRGLGAGGDPDQGRAAALANEAELKAMCAGANIVFIAAGLGGGTGTGAAPVLARIAREEGALVLGLVTLPFDFEGGRRQRQALLGLHQFKAEADGVICLPNQKMFKLIDQNTNVTETFRLTNELLAQGVHGIWRLLNPSGLMSIDFADLCALTRGKHSESALATVEASGEHRVRETWEKLKTHPLLEGDRSLGMAETILVNFVGGPDLTMTEINRFMELLNRQAEHADIKMGASVDPSFGARLSITVLVSYHPEKGIHQPERPAEVSPRTESAPNAANLDLNSALLPDASQAHANPRFVPPATSISMDRASLMLDQPTTPVGRRRRRTNGKQGQLPLDIVPRDRFDKCERTIYQGEDLDVPTYIRRGMPLN